MSASFRTLGTNWQPSGSLSHFRFFGELPNFDFEGPHGRSPLA